MLKQTVWVVTHNTTGEVFKGARSSFTFNSKSAASNAFNYTTERAWGSYAKYGKVKLKDSKDWTAKEVFLTSVEAKESVNTPMDYVRAALSNAVATGWTAKDILDDSLLAETPEHFDAAVNARTESNHVDVFDNTALYDFLALSYKNDATPQAILVAGLCSEAGEVAAEWLKEVRVDRPNGDRTKEFLSELSDVLWYVSILAQERDSSLFELMTLNLGKLHDRSVNGKA